MKPIKDVISQVVENLSLGKTDLYYKIQLLWEEVFSKEEKKHTTVREFHEGTLTIQVDNSAYLFQMNLKRAKILERFQQGVPEIKTILFKMGNIK